MDLLTYLLPDPEVALFDSIYVDSASKMIACTASMTQPIALCPLCRQPSTRIHSRYRRTLGDLPWAGLSVQIGLHVRRFLCDNTDCQRKIFCERLPTVAAPWARRTQRLANAQQAIGLATGGAGGSKLCTALSMNAGVDLLLDLIRTLQIPERMTPRVLGVDDWAKRKGHSYGTILVDLEQGEVVDVLPDRTSESLQQWLMTHPGVEIISRDRAGAYAEGARLGAPDAVQVADRWHLLKNLTDAVYKALQQHHTEIEGALIQGSPQEPPSIQTTDTHLSVLPDVQQPTEADRARQQRAEEAHRLYGQGWTTMAIATHLGLSPKTVRCYLNQPLPLPPAQRRQRSSLLDPYKPYIIDRWNAGCHTATQLYREIQSQGFTGQDTIVRAYIAQLRRAGGLAPGVRNAIGKKIKDDPGRRPPTIRGLAFLVMRSLDQLDEQEKQHVDLLMHSHPKIQTTVELARQFAVMVRHQQAHLLDEWLVKAIVSQVPSLRSFALGIQQDESAVRAALSLQWSNGPTEGHINRLKSLKRSMYGRAKLDLLRLRMLAA